MSLILIFSILIRLVALGWSMAMLRRLRDWRMGFLTVMLALMALRQILTLLSEREFWAISITGHVTELPGLAVSVMAFLAVFFLERVLSERKRAEDNLRKSETKYRTLVEHLPAVTYIAELNRTSTTLYHNPLLDSILGDPKGDTFADPEFWVKCLHPDDRQRVLAELGESHRSGEPFVSEYRMVCRDGRIVWFRDQAVVVRDDNEKPCSLQGVMVDISQRKQVEEALRQAYDELEMRVQERTADLMAANRRLQDQITARNKAEERLRTHQTDLAHVVRLSTMGEMVSSIAHEVNQPLFAIANYTSGCVRKLRMGQIDPDELIDIIERTAKQAERAGKIIYGIRNFVRKEEPKRTQVDINELVQEVMLLLDYELQRAGLEFRSELETRLPPVLADAIQIEQVILNLVRNAIEAMESNGVARGQLFIQTSNPTNDVVEVAISDTGYGLPQDNADQLFEPFFTTKSDGMGMGLSISDSIIQAYGGQLTATANPEGGATFRFTLPVARGAQGI